MSAPYIEQHLEPLYSVQQVARAWAISDASARRLFEDEPDVLKISMPRLQQNRKHKPHVLLRIPAAAVTRVYQKWSAGFGLKVKPGSRRIK